MSGFSITYETITHESAEDGEAAASGFLVENVTFREAVDRLYGCRSGHVEADSYSGSRPHNPRWFTFYEAETDMATGDVTNYSLHLPRHITAASRMRIARLVGCHGAR